MIIQFNTKFCSPFLRNIVRNDHLKISATINIKNNLIIYDIKNVRRQFHSFNTPLQQKHKTESNVITKSNQGNHQLSEHVKVTERIKQTTKDVSYLSVILIGIGITGFVFYVVFKEFFSSKSPSSVFSIALEKCKNDPRVTEALGDNIKGHGERTARRRARHVSFVEYENNGKVYIRVKFYLKGSKGTASVQCETDKASSRSNFRYLFVQMDSYPNQVIIVEDNRLIE